VTDDIDLIADLNAEDDDGLGWSTLADARTPDRVAPGAMVLAGNRLGQAGGHTKLSTLPDELRSRPAAQESIASAQELGPWRSFASTNSVMRRR